MFFYAHFPDLGNNLNFQRKKMRMIEIHNLPFPLKETKAKKKKTDLKPIPIPKPVKTEIVESPPDISIIPDEELLDNEYIFGEGEFTPPDYDDILIGVLGRTAKEGECIYEPPIKYPEEDVRAFIEGEIVLKLTVNKRGKVISAYVEKGVGNTAIERAAKEAAFKRLYKPVTRNGKPVYFQTKWIIDFNIK